MLSGTTLTDSNNDIAQEEPASLEIDRLAALSTESAADVYTLNKSFEDLKALLDQYKAVETADKSTSGDEKAFKTCKQAMDKFYAKGLIAQNLPWDKKTNIPKIILAALAAVKVFESTFKSAKIKPVAGPKSANYCNKVVIPYLKLLAEVQHEEWLIYICSFKIVRRDLAKEKLNTLALAGEYEKLTAKFITLDNREVVSNVATLNIVGQFAVNAEHKQPDKQCEVIQENRL